MGMSLGGGNKKKVTSDINVVPLVDITLVLLIIFMVMTPMMQRGYDMSIPEKSQVVIPQPVPTDQMVVTMTVDGRININKDTVAPEAVKGKLAELLAGRSQKTVFFQAHPDLFYQEVISVMDSIRAAGGVVGLVTTDLQ